MDKNKKIKIIISLLALTLIFPPWYYIYNGNVINSGFDFIFNLSGRQTVNIPFLLTEWIAIGILGFLLNKIDKK